MLGGLLAAGCVDDGDPVATSSPPVTSGAASSTGAGGGPAADRWTGRAPAPFERTEVGAGVHGGRIWVLGGFTGAGEVSADAASYDPATDSWRPEPAIPEPVHHAAVAGDGPRLWIAGGYLGRDFARPTDAVRVLGADGRWADGPALPQPRAAGAMAWDGTRLLYGGGVGPDGLSGDVFALDGGTWRRIGELSTAREHLAAASDGTGTTWFLAGRTGGLDSNLADVDTVVGDRVERAGAVPTPRGGVAGFHVPGRGGCVAGGEQPAGTHGEVECLTADGTASTLPPLGTARHGLGAAVVGDTAYVLLGGRSPGLAVSDVVEAIDVTPGG